MQVHTNPHPQKSHFLAPLKYCFRPPGVWEPAMGTAVLGYLLAFIQIL